MSRLAILASSALLFLLCPNAHAIAVPDTMEQRAKACVGCHDDQGRSTAEGFLPRIAGKPTGYLFEELRSFRDGRRQHSGMARLLENLDDRMLRELANNFASRAPQYAAPRPRAADPESVARAAQIVRHGLPNERLPACASCHGHSLVGVEPDVPGLVGLPRDYIVAQLGAWRSGARRGREPDCMRQVAKLLQPSDIPLLADWLATQDTSAPPPSQGASHPALPQECRRAKT